MVYPPAPHPCRSTSGLACASGAGFESHPLRICHVGGRGLLVFLDFPHALPHTVWVAVVSRVRTNVSMGGLPMSRAKHASKRKSRACAVPLLGAAGLSLSLASGAPASTGGPPTGIPTQNTGVSHEITFGGGNL